jgi:hypothetical protein
MHSRLTSNLLDLARAVCEEIGDSKLRSCVDRTRRPNGYAHLDQLDVRRDAGGWAHLRVWYVAAGVGSHSQHHFPLLRDFMRFGERLDQIARFQFGRVEDHPLARLLELRNVVAADVLILDRQDPGFPTHRATRTSHPRRWC